ncbi:MAG: type II toxin-antitoxin system VapC family toxin [Treponema sp.]|nr:type II toxin-antitoxin system VapC family toxin [Treponema sp.]
MKYLLDTNVISELQKSKCSQNVRSFLETIQWDDAYLSVITIGELCYGIEKLPDGKKKHELSIWLYTKMPEWFAGRIVELDTETLLEWGRLRARTGRTLPIADSLLAAQAITNHLFLVTRNIKDFDGIEGINLLNPWEF